MLILHVLNGTDEGVTFRLDGDQPEIIGRRSVRLKLNDTRVSRHHCELARIDGTWTIRDLGSSNGTYVNSARITRLTELEDGDELLIGRLRLRVGVDEPAAVKRSKPKPKPAAPLPVRLELELPEEEEADQASVAAMDVSLDAFERAEEVDRLSDSQDLGSFAASFADSSVGLDFVEDAEAEAEAELEAPKSVSRPASPTQPEEPEDAHEAEARPELPMGMGVEPAEPMEAAPTAEPAARSHEQRVQDRAERQRAEHEREAAERLSAEQSRQWAHEQARADAARMREQRSRFGERRLVAAAMRAVAIAQRRAEEAAALAAEARRMVLAPPEAAPPEVALEIPQAPLTLETPQAPEPPETLELAEILESPEALASAELPESPEFAASQLQEQASQEPDYLAEVLEHAATGPKMEGLAVAEPAAMDAVLEPIGEAEEAEADVFEVGGVGVDKDVQSMPGRADEPAIRPNLDPLREVGRGRRYPARPRRGRMGKAIGLIALVGVMGTVGWLIFVDPVLNSQPVMGRSGSAAGVPGVSEGALSSSSTLPPEMPPESAQAAKPQVTPEVPSQVASTAVAPTVTTPKPAQAAQQRPRVETPKASPAAPAPQPTKQTQAAQPRIASAAPKAPSAALPAMAGSRSALDDGAPLVGRAALEGRVARPVPVQPVPVLATELTTADAHAVMPATEAERMLAWNARSAYSPTINPVQSVAADASANDAAEENATAEAVEAVPAAPQEKAGEAEKADAAEPEPTTLALAIPEPADRGVVVTERARPVEAEARVEVDKSSAATAPARQVAGGAKAEARPQVAASKPSVAAAPARRVAFLLDASGSTVDTLPRMIEWLGLAMDKLSPQDHFVVIFFRQGEAVEAGGPGLKAGHAAVKRAVWDWVQPERENFQSFGKSDAEMALKLALSYGVSEVYLLSDDTFGVRRRDGGQDAVLTQIEDCLTGREAKLHAVQFFYHDDDGLLKTIAQRFGGTYEFIEPEMAEPAGKLGDANGVLRP